MPEGLGGLRLGPASPPSDQCEQRPRRADEPPTDAPAPSRWPPSGRWPPPAARARARARSSGICRTRARTAAPRDALCERRARTRPRSADSRARGGIGAPRDDPTRSRPHGSEVPAQPRASTRSTSAPMPRLTRQHAARKRVVASGARARESQSGRRALPPARRDRAASCTPVLHTSRTRTQSASGRSRATARERAADEEREVGGARRRHVGFVRPS